MKFTLASISAALLAVSAVSGSVINKRQEDAASSEQNQIISQYPSVPDLGALNGTWYLTGATQSVWNVYDTLQKTMNLQLNCVQLNVTKSSNTSFDAFASAFITKAGSNVGVNASAAAAFYVGAPDSATNVTDGQLLWTAYASQLFVNGAQWSNFTSDGQSQQNVTDSGSKPVPGTKPLEATVYSKLIDSNSKPGDNSTNVDTVFLWASKFKFYESSDLKKRADEIYGLILSKSSSVNQDAFNRTVALLPPAIAQNNISVVMLNDTCTKQQQ